MWSDSDDEVLPVLYSLVEASELNEAKSREWWVHPYNKKRDAENVINNMMAELRMYPAKFKDFTRMNIETFDYLLALIEKSIAKQNTNYRKSITPGERLFITLRYIATGKTYKSLAYQFRCGEATIGKIILETCQAIWDTLSPIYLAKPNAQKWTSIADVFNKMWNFPNCLGALGGKHIRLQCPPKVGPDRHKYKKSHSIHLQAVVDAHGQLICVDFGDFERNYDSGALQQSNFGKQVINKDLNLPQRRTLCPESHEYIPYVFVADEGYPLLMNVMKPFAHNHLTTERRIYNYRLSRARRVVECAFGMLTKRFHIFDTVLLLPPNKVELIILAACVLHNMIRERESLLQEIYIEREGMEDAVIGETNKNLYMTRPSNAARQIRNQFVSYFNSATGSVSWQHKYAT